jgi:hypothetical protein
MKLYRTGAPPLMRERRINNINNAHFAQVLQPLKSPRQGIFLHKTRHFGVFAFVLRNKGWIIQFIPAVLIIKEMWSV